MRAQTPPSIEGFREFYTARKNIDAMVRQLAGGAATLRVLESDLRRALDNLDRYFVYFATVDHLHELVSTFLSRFCAPNVLMSRLNRTEPAYRLDITCCAEEVRQVNTLDVRLYESVRRRPRRLRVDPCDRALSPMTVFIDAICNDRQSLNRRFHHRTERLMELLADEAGALRRPTWAA